MNVSPLTTDTYIYLKVSIAFHGQVGIMDCMVQLLTTSNPKTQKGIKRGYLTTIQHFAPSKLSGTNVCTDATPECIRYCLNKAGRGGIYKKGETTNRIQEARVKRTQLFLDDFLLYKAQLVKEIASHIKKAEKLGLEPCVRLNGTSDLAWEAEPVYAAETSSVFWRFAGVQFYDYTKSFDRYMSFLNGPWPTQNYYLTFSRSELNHAQCIKILSLGGSVAAVFDDVPDNFCGYPVLDGDTDDLRFMDTQGCWVGLKAKGKLKQSYSPFKVEIQA